MSITYFESSELDLEIFTCPEGEIQLLLETANGPAVVTVAADDARSIATALLKAANDVTAMVEH